MGRHFRRGAHVGVVGNVTARRGVLPPLLRRTSAAFVHLFVVGRRFVGQPLGGEVGSGPMTRRTTRVTPTYVTREREEREYLYYIM
jgi:hypothetical protein